MCLDGALKPCYRFVRWIFKAVRDTDKMRPMNV